ncbi:MAG: pyridoxamine 5'-phosphate oxidase family protein [Pseudonocardiaceae bacterium]
MTSRPYMPGYGTRPSDQGSGLLPWSWAVERLRTSRNYWLATAGANGQPHAMPVWGVWMDDAVWFSSGLRSRKMRNLSEQPRCSLSTQDPEEPVMLQGIAELITEHERIAEFLAASNTKYAANVEMDFLDPAVNSTVRVAPRTVIGLKESDFQGSPTRWRFPS